MHELPPRDRMLQAAFGFRGSIESSRKARSYKKRLENYPPENSVDLAQLWDLTTDAFYHNVSIDCGEERLSTALNNPLIDAAEVDLSKITFSGRRSGLFIAHRADIFKGLVRKDPSLIESQKARVVIAHLFGRVPKIHIDLKLYDEKDSEAQVETAKLINQISPQNEVFISGRNWKVVGNIDAMVTRPRTTLLTVDGHFRNSLSRVEEAYVRLFGDQPAREFGVSVRDSFLDEEKGQQIVQDLRDQNFYVLVHTVNSIRRAVEIANFGVNGITSDRSDIVAQVGFNRKIQEYWQTPQGDFTMLPGQAAHLLTI